MKTAAQILYQIKRNMAAVEKAQRDDDRIRANELEEKQELLTEKLAQAVGMSGVSVERGDELRARMVELGISQEDADGLGWVLGDGGWC